LLRDKNNKLLVTLVFREGEGLYVNFVQPEIRNPLSVSVLQFLHGVMDNAATQQMANIVFTGKNDVFASGANLNEIAGVTAELAPAFAFMGQSLMHKIAHARQRTIAAINGYCFGGALDLALACDMRIASPNAVLCHPGVNLGIMTGWGGTQRLPRLIGEAKALEMFLTARQVTADEALQMGLIDKISENFRQEIAELAEN
jgi:enoyl-CoA hydratase